VALAGTFQELHDLYREVLIKHDKHDAQVRLERYIACYPTFERVEQAMAAAGLTGAVEIDEFSLLFRSARELFYAPVIEYGPLADWKAVAGGGQDSQDVFWYIKQAIDAYFADAPFHLAVKAACVVGRKPVRASDAIVESSDPADGLITTPITLIAPRDIEDDAGDTGSAFDDIDTGLPWPRREIADGSVRAEQPELAATEPTPGTAEPATGAAEPALADDPRAEQELDAFIEGQKRTQTAD
jgi:hypothetical protein